MGVEESIGSVQEGWGGPATPGASKGQELGETKAVEKPCPMSQQARKLPSPHF